MNDIKIRKEKIRDNLLDISYNLEQLLKVWENVEDEKELEILEHIYDLAGLEESSNDLAYKFELLNKYSKNTKLIEKQIVFIGNSNKLNIVTNNKHYTVSSLAELRELKDDFTNLEINSFINFYLEH